MVEKNTISSAIDKLRSLPWHNLFYMFYIEPIIIMLIFSHMLSGVVMRNQIIYQTCKVIFHYNESDCSRLDDKNASSEIRAIETEMQSYVADMFLTRTLMESIVPAVCGLFIGAWSDRYGRKPLLVISMIGFTGSALITATICALSSYHDINPWWYTLAAVPHSLLGGMCVFSVAAFCFISDITDIKTRPYRMIAIEALMFIALSSGSLLSSYVYEATSAAITQGISAAILVVATIFSIFYFPESLHISLAKEKAENAQKDEKDLSNIVCDTQLNAVFSKETKRENEKDEKDSEPKLVSELDNKNGLKANENKKESSTNEPCTTEIKLDDKKEPKPMDTLPSAEKAEMKSDSEERNVGLFSITHIKDMIKTSCKPREHHAREIIWLVTLAMFISIFIIDGATTVMYLFVRQKFHWSVREFTFFETIAQVVSMLGALIGFLMLRKVFGLSVVTLALFAFGSEVLCNLTKGFATLSWHMYLSIAFGIFRSIGQPMCRTIVSNIVPASDLGKIFSIKNVLQSFAPFVAAPVYTLIYQHSLSVWPGLFNLVSAALFLASFIAIGFVWRYKFVYKEHYAKLLK